MNYNFIFPIRRKTLSVVVVLVFFLSHYSLAQENDKKDDSSPYELMSSYYNKDFHPFKKRNIYIGMAFGLEDKQSTNTIGLFENIIDGDRLNYDLLLRAGYYTGNYGMAGINFKYYQNRFAGEVFREPDTLQSNSISRGIEFTPNFRSSVPLTDNERLSFFTEVGLTFGFGNTLRRTIKDLDVVDKTYSSDFNFRVGISPGITFFAMENFAFEIQLNVVGYELQVRDQKVNDGVKSREIRQNVDFNIDLLSLNLGLAYYFGSKR
ncbi:hypothetical protein [Algoriphagus marinus]|uniref:hypothetical protein n=1 Tax=Algoriphagus marinus TaxID=1925762 RepID=UPI00094BB117|nr:hypothetical protein [Algoriphagus marinus]